MQASQSSTFLKGGANPRVIQPQQKMVQNTYLREYFRKDQEILVDDEDDMMDVGYEGAQSIESVEHRLDFSKGFDYAHHENISAVSTS